jgi:hypothetical protein
VALSGGDLRYLRRKVGSLPDDAALQTIYDAYEADAADQPLEWVVLDVLEGRLADLIRNPATFAVAGEYSQSTAANIAALEDQIKAHRNYMTSLGIALDVSDGVPFAITAAADPDFVR